MTLFQTSHKFNFRDLSPEQTDQTGTALLDALLEQEGVLDADLEAVLSRGEIEITFSVDAETVDESLELAIAAMQSAITAQGQYARVHWAQILDGKEISAVRAPVGERSLICA